MQEKLQKRKKQNSRKKQVEAASVPVAQLLREKQRLSITLILAFN